MSVFGGVKVPPVYCGYWLGDKPCGELAPYRVFFARCPSCADSGRAECTGHGVCDEHAIHSRNGNRRSPVDGRRLTVLRIKSQGRDPSQETAPVEAIPNA